MASERTFPVEPIVGPAGFSVENPLINEAMNRRSGEHFQVVDSIVHMARSRNCVANSPTRALRIAPPRLCAQPVYAECSPGLGRLFRGSKQNGAPGWIRTSDRSLRRRVLYPTELQARCAILRGCDGVRLCGARRSRAPVRGLRRSPIARPGILRRSRPLRHASRNPAGRIRRSSPWLRRTGRR